MANNGIEDILIGESYKSTKKKSKGPIILLIILMLAGAAIYGWYYYTNRQVLDEKVLFANSFLSASTRKLSDGDFYSTVFDRILQENSEMSSNITISSTEKFDILQDIDINNFDFDLTSQNDLKGKNFTGELLVKYSGNDFLKFQGIINDNKFAIVSDEIVNRYVGVKSQNFNNIFDSKIDLQFIYEFINAEELGLSKEEKQSYLENYYNKIYNQISLEKFSRKDNIVITKDNDYIDVTAYELSLNQSELNDIVVNVLTELKNDENLLNAVTSKESVELDLSGTENEDDDLQVRNDENTVKLQLVPVSEQNFQTAQEVENEENEETNPETEENIEPIEENNNDFIEENIEDNNEGLELTTSDIKINKEFTTSDLIKILLGKRVNISKDKLIEKIEEYIGNLDGSGLVVTVYVSEEKTEKISLTLPDENKIDIQFLENTDKENNVEFTYLYKASDYKDGISINIDEIHNSASSSIKLVKNYIENEKINKKVTFSLKTDGTKNANSLSNDVVITISTNSNETKIMVDNKIKFLSKNLVLDKLTEENCLFIDDLEKVEMEETIQAIKDKINQVLEDKKANMNLIDLNSKTSIVSKNLNSTTTNSYLLIRNELQNIVDNIKNQAIENGEEPNLQSLNDISIEGYDISTNVDEERAVIVIDIYTFVVDRDFNISDA